MQQHARSSADADGQIAFRDRRKCANLLVRIDATVTRQFQANYAYVFFLRGFLAAGASC